MFFNNFARGIQIFASPKNPALNNFVVDGNVSFNNGTISGMVGRYNLLISAPVPTAGMVATNNMLYYSPGAEGVNIRLGHYAAANNRDLVLRGNYAGGGRLGLEMKQPWAQAVVEQNVFAGEGLMVEVGGNGGTQYRWSGNRYYRDPGAPAWRYGKKAASFADWRRATGLGATDEALATPPDNKVFVRPNKYEPGRATIVVYNWRGAATVSVDVASVLRAGDQFELRNVQALFDAPLVNGTYRGDSIAIPMTGVVPPPPTGRPGARPPRTAPTFDVFLLTTRPR